MSDFDLDSFFAQRGLQTLQGESPEVVSKEDKLLAASLKKQEALSQAIARRQHKLTQTVAGRVGLNADGFVGTAINTAAATVNDVTKAAGEIAAVPAELYAAYEINENENFESAKSVREVADRIRSATRFDEYLPQNADGSAQSGLHRQLMQDLALTGLKSATHVAEIPVGLASLVSGGAAGKAVEDAGIRFKDARDAIDAAMSPEQRAAAKAVDDADGFMDTLNTALDNPRVIGHAIAESVPSMLAGGLVGRGAALLPKVSTGAAAGIGEGTVMAAAMAEGIRSQTEDGLLTPGQAALAAGTGVVGGIVGLTGASLSKMLRLGDVDEAVVQGAIQQGQRGAAARVTGGTAIEAGEETLQSAEETIAENVALDRDPLANVGDAMAMGLLTGGAMGGTMNLAAKGPEKDNTAIDETVTGDPAPYLDRTSKLYDPAKAGQMVFNASRKEGMSEPEKIELRNQFNSILSQAEEDLESVQNRLALSDPEQDGVRTEYLNGLKAELAQMVAGSPEAQELSQRVSAMEQVFEQAKNRTPAQIKELEREAERAQRQVDKLQILQGHTENFTQTEQPSVEQTLEAMKSPETAPKATDDLITLTMTSPDLTDSRALELADDLSLPLTDTHRSYLRAFAASKAAENALKQANDVNSDVLDGGKGFVGINQYKERIATALRAGDTAKATAQLTKLEAFTRDRIAKLKAATAAYQKVRGTDNVISLERLDNGQWRERATPFANEQERRANGGLNVAANFGKLLTTFQQEAGVAQKAFLQMREGLAMKGGQTTSKEVSPTTPEAVGESSSIGKVTKATPAQNKSASQLPQVNKTGISSGSDAAPSNTGSSGIVLSNVSDIETVSPTLAVFDLESDVETTGEAYTKANLIAQFFQQKKDRVLTQVANLVSKLRSEDAQDVVNEYAKLSDNPVLQARQTAAILDFAHFAQLGQQPVRDLLQRKASPEFNYQNLMTFFMDDQEVPDIDENLKTAIALAGYTWLAENGTKLVNYKDDINAMLGRDSRHPVTNEEYGRFGQIGTRSRVVADSMGQRVYQALGLTTKGDIPADLRPRLIAQLGEYASALLVKQGLLERTAYDNTLFEGVAGVENLADVFEGAQHFFIRPVEINGTVHPTIEKLVATNRGTEGAVADFFGVESTPLEPSLSPKAFKQAKTKNAEMDVPANLAEILEKEQGKRHETNHDMLHAVSVLDRDLIEAVMGVDHTPDMLLHVSNRKGVEAKNKSLREELDNALAFFEKLRGMADNLETPFYFQREVWRQQRVGLRERLFNPQTSKVHRHLTNMEGWRTTVKFADPKMVNNFKIAVMEAMGVKTDKQPNSKTVEDFNTWYTKNQQAITAMHDALFLDHVSPEGQRAIREAVVGKEGMFSLDALVQVAKYKEAQDAGRESFVTHFFREVDGKTNGPILSILQLGAARNADSLYETINRGGMYSVDNKANHYSEYRAQSGAADLYEMLAKEIHERIGTMQMDALFAHVSRFTGALMKGDEVSSAGRNLVKTPLTAMVFGAGVKGTVENMAEAFVQKIYNALQDAVQAEDVATQKELLTTVNEMLAAKHQVNVDMAAEEILELQFNPSQVSALKMAFQVTVGEAVQETLEEKFAVFLQRRALLNNAAQASFELYDIAYKQLKQELIEELKAKGELRVRKNKKGELIQVADLSESQEQMLRDRLKGLNPVVHTPLSKMAGDLSAGLYLAKDQRNPSTSPVYEGQLNFPKGAFQQTTLKSAAYESSEVNPGVAALIMMIHSGDSAISSLAYNLSHALNVHDAHGLGLWEVEAGAKRLNQNTFTVMRDYSAPSELVAAFERTLTGFMELVEQGELEVDALTGDDLKNLTKALTGAVHKLPDSAKGTLLADPLTNFLRLVKRTAYNADKVRLASMAKAKSYDQYSMEGGSYTVTEDDRKTAAEMEAALVKDVDAELLEKTSALSQRLGLAKKDKEAVKQTKQIKRNVVSKQTPAVALNVLEKVAQQPQEPEVQEGLQQVEQSLREGHTLEEAVQTVDPVTAAEITQQAGDAYNPRQHTEMGEKGTPVLGLERVDRELEAVLAKHQTMPARDLMAVLNQRLAGKGNLRAMQRALLKELHRTVSDVQVHYVTEATDPATLKGDLRKVSGARGWYVVSTDGEHIYLRSSEFKDAGVIPEVILHELVHAAVTRTIRQAQKEGKGDAYALVQDLERIRAKATQHVNDNGLAGQYGHVVGDLDEFIAWGMTNAGFQRDVLNQFGMASKTKGNSLIEAARTFWETLTGLIFRNSDKTKQQQATRALTLVMKDVAGLFEAARQSRGNQSVEDMTLTYEDPQYLTTLQIQEALEQADTSLDPDFKQHLRNLLETVVDKLHGPFGSYKVEAEKQRALTEEDVFIKALDTGVMPFASKTLAAQFKLSLPEIHAIEQIEVALREGLSYKHADSYPVIRSLEKLHREARDTIKVQDLIPGKPATPTQDELDLAQAKWDHLFKVEGDQDDHLARFAALALASQELQPLLRFETQKLTDNSTGVRWLDALYQVFEKFMQLLNGRLIKSYGGQQADAKLAVLIDQLVSVESKHKRRLIAAGNTLPDVLDRSLAALTAKGRERLEAFGKSDLFMRNKSQVTKALGAGLSAIAGDRVGQIMDGYQQIRDTTFKTRQGVLSHAMTELRGQTDTNVFAHVLVQLASRMEQIRQQLKAHTAKAVLEGFADQGKYLTRETKEAVTKVVLRTDMQALLGPFSLGQLMGLVQDKTARQQAIVDWEAKLAAVAGNRQLENFYRVSAKETAYMMVTGKAVGDAVYRNTHGMARLWGSSRQGQITEAQAKQVQEILEPLVSLYALDFSPSHQLTQMNTVIKAEMERTDGGNGIEQTLLLHRQLQQDAHDRIFKDSEALMVKGYTPEIYNPYIEITAATPKEGLVLQRSGWSQGSVLEQDQHDPNFTPRRLYTVHSGGMQRRQTGALSLTSMKVQGSLLDMGTATNAQNVHANKQRSIDNKFRPGTQFSTGRAAHLVPVFNPNGNIVDWRYLMQENTKDTLLERDNAVEEILGTFASQTFDKEMTPIQNRKAIEALKEQFDAEYRQNPGRYVKVGPTSSDAEQRENWQLLPDATKAAIRDVWGKDDMFVRIDLLDHIFGYRMPSITGAFKKDADERNLMEKLFVEGLTSVMFTVMKRKEPGLTDKDREAAARKAALRVHQAEDMWQELVREIKDILVIKNIITLVGNIKSNLSLLLLYGVGPRDLVRNHRIALQGALDYRRDNAELIRLNLLRSSGYNAGSNPLLEQDIALLENAIARNPVRELIEAGLMPTIVEDVGMVNDAYSYKSVLAGKLTPFTNKVPKPLKTLGKLVYMTQDTAPYQFLSQTTQLSDFVARFTLYQHLTTRAVEPLTKTEALQQATEAFIHYDIPTHRTIQYLNNMGILPFTKYYMRIQKVIFQLWRTNPARALAMLSFNMFFDGVQTVMDSSIVARLGNNPLQWGALQYPAVLGELPLVKLGMSPLN